MKPLSLRGAVTVVGAVLAVLAAISLPTGYFFSGYSNLARHLDFKAELNAAYLAKYINAHSDVWRFQTVRIAELLSQTDSSGAAVRRRVLDSAGNVVLDEGGAVPAPALTRSQRVVVAGSDVARVELQTSLQPLLAQVALVGLFGALLGLGVFAALRIFPLRVLDRTMEQLERSNRELAQTNRRFTAALAHMPLGLSMFDSEGRLVVSNERYAQMYDLPPELVKPGSAFYDILKYRHALGVLNEDPGLYWERMQARLRVREPQMRVVNAGQGRSVAIVNTPIPDGGWISIHEDITDRLAAQAKISHMALHDGLTNLPNRLFFQEQMESRLSHLGRGQKFAVLCFDLDRFKSVNDTLGHAFGDRLLRQVAERMRKCLREGDTLARLGSDEFAILQSQVDHAEDASALAARLIDDLAVPFDLDGHQAAIGVSIGIAIAPVDGRQPEQLLKSADIALYRAKAEGKGTYRFFEPQMDRLMQARRELELDLREAIARDQFELHYQPLVNLKTETISGFEALLRWNHPQRGPIEPLAFIPLAEETALIVPIGEWALRTACKEAATWPKDLAVAVNLSAVQFRMRGLPHMVASALAHSGLAAHRLQLEITESVLLVENASTLATLHQLRALGVRISMDDFGTGYSSLSYLRSFPFDKIKIDGTFVRGLAHDPDSRAIVRAVAGLGASLGMATTGEGVETREEADFLRREGCTEAQGYFFGKAMTATEVKAALAGSKGALSAVA
ncbi:MAG: EAL domain-containing protein [Pseudorhodoplanes sp.]|nr:EAL domain-containing protein [Pseudorhodoplanes sp.]